MRILLTNDDGIYAKGLQCLYKVLKKIGSVTVVAPDSERSSIGHAITLCKPLTRKKIKLFDGSIGHALSGTPADCVKFGVDQVLKKKPDLIISGINHGPNDGCSIHYSGTVAGAREGAMLGIPSFAFSLNSFQKADFDFSVKIAVKIINSCKTKKIPLNTFLNVNIPNLPSSKVKGVCFTKQCLIPIHGTFVKKIDPFQQEIFWLNGKQEANKNNLEFDTYALAKNYVTVTPIKIDNTDYEFYNLMSGESIKL